MLWRDYRDKMYRSFTVPEFIQYVNEMLNKGWCWIGRNGEGLVDAILVFEPRLSTIYVEAFIGNTKHYRQVRKELFSQYSNLSYHKGQRLLTTKLVNLWES